jgi:hypothetical protein
MGLISHLLVLGFAAVVVLCALAFVVVDMFGRVDYLKTNFPWLERILERRSALGILVLVTIFLLIGDGYELVLKEIPEPVGPPVVNIKLPPPPIINQPTKPSDAPSPKTGPTSAKPPVQPPAEAPMLTGIRIASQRRIPSDDAKLPYGLEVVVQTDVDIEPVAIAILCDGNIGKANGGLSSGGAYTMTVQGLAAGHPNVFLLEWKSPAWTPSESIVVNLFSETSIRAKSVQRIQYKWP